MKRLFILLFLGLLLIGSISALEINASSEFYFQETLIAEISGDFYDQLTEENIFLYQRNARIPFDFELEKMGDKYYLSTLLDKEPGNYSLIIENLNYFKENKLVDEEVEKQFLIKNETTDFYIEPGFISAEEDFFIKIMNPNEEETKVDIDSKLVDENNVEILPNSFKEIYVNIEDVEESSLNTIEMSSDNIKYLFRAYIYVQKGEEDIEEKKENFILSPSTFKIKLSTNSTVKRIIYIYNNGDIKIENIEVEISDSLKNYLTFTENIPELYPGKSKKINLEISSNLISENVSGKIIAKSNNTQKTSFMEINFIEGFIPSEEDNQTEIVPDPSIPCSEMNGTICLNGKTCSGEETYARDGVCCLGQCKEEEKGPNSKLVGWILIIVVLAILVYLFMKFKKTKNPVNLLKIAEGRR